MLPNMESTLADEPGIFKQEWNALEYILSILPTVCAKLEWNCERVGTYHKHMLAVPTP